MKSTKALGQMSVAALATLIGAAIHAQTTPDAGRLLNEGTSRMVRPPRAMPRLQDTAPEALRPALTAAQAAPIQVSAFRITHGTVFKETELQAVLSPYVGKSLSLTELRRAADLLTDYYRARGYLLARAYLPEQDIVNGVVEIALVEGTISHVSAELTPGVRLADSRINAALEAQQGGVAQVDRIDRAMLLLNDLPGINARVTLAPGRDSGSSELHLRLDEGDLLSGLVDSDNFGNRFTGDKRVGVELNLSDPTGRGDLATLRGQATSDLRLLRAGYQLPLGNDGFKLGLNGSALQYRLCCDFTTLDASGKANEVALVASYPLKRSRLVNTNVSASVTARDMVNQTSTGITSDKNVRTLSLSVNGDARQGDGITVWNMGVTTGRADLSAWAPDLAADDLSARVNGNFAKWAYSIHHEQRVTDAWSFRILFAGQIAKKNLDSSEQISLGGPFGVRAYAGGEATGDSGRLLNMEVKYRAGASWEVAGFLDQGWIRLHHTPWLGWQGINAALPNDYSIAGAGAGVTWFLNRSTALRLLWGHRLGDNPGASSAGKDSDGRALINRFWLQASAQF